MKIKRIAVRVERRLGLPDYSSIMVSVEEDAELEDGERAVEVRDAITDRLLKFTQKKIAEGAATHSKEFGKKK